MELAVPLFPSRTLHLLYLTCISSAEMASLQASVASLALDVALLDPALILSPRVVASGASKALLSLSARGRPIASTLHGDLVRCVHGGKSVAEAHRLLAAPRGSAALLAVLDAARGIGGVCGGGPAEANLAALAARVGGTVAPWAGGAADAAAVAAAWRVAPAEAALEVDGADIGALEAAVLIRIGCGVDVA